MSDTVLHAKPLAWQQSITSSGYNSTYTTDSESLQISPVDKKSLFCSSITHEVVADAVHRALFPDEECSVAPSKYALKMRLLTAEMSDKHEYVLSGMMRRLEKEHTSWTQTIRIVADEIFADGIINWGRIISLFTFVQKVTQFARDNPHLQQDLSVLQVHSHTSAADGIEEAFSQDSETGERLLPTTSSSTNSNTYENPSSDKRRNYIRVLKRSIAAELEQYVNIRLGSWIEDNGGWDAFLTEFTDLDSRFENGLLKSGLVVVGLAALAGYLIMR